VNFLLDAYRLCYGATVVEDGSQEDVDTTRAQLQYSYEALRALAAIGIQVGGFLVTADALLLGYGLSQKHAGFLLLASALPLLLMLLAAFVVAHGLPMVYVAIRAERTLAPSGGTLCSTYLRLRAPRLLRKINQDLDAGEIGNVPAGFRRHLHLFSLVDLRATGNHLMILVWLGHVALAAVGIWFFSYRLM
jgi:hypothetical protein